MSFVFNIAICDDDAYFVEKISEKINGIMKLTKYNYNIIEFYDGKELISHCKKELTDIIFVDIDMPNMDGFNIVSELKKSQPYIVVIFVTSHNELAYRAYDYYPYQFIDKKDLNKLDVVLCDLLNKLIYKKRYSGLFHLKLNNIIDVDLNQIVYFKSKKNYVYAYNESEINFSVRAKIKDIYEQLSVAGFIYVQRQYVVNCRFIEDLSRKRVKLKTGEEITFTRNEQKIRDAQKMYARFKRDMIW